MKSLAIPLLMTIITTGCMLQTLPQQADSAPNITISTKPLAPKIACEGRFIARDLAHTTSIRGDVVRMFESNGSGLAINDLDNDGDLDIVLGNLAGNNAIFWNEGSLSFRKETFSHGQTRAVNIVDIDGDGWQDIIFAHRTLRPFIWMSNGVNVDGKVTFTRQNSVDIVERVYTMAWADLDADNDLDAVIATYQIETEQEGGAELVGGGVVYYENDDDRLIPTQLALRSQALALLLVDVNGDGQIDIWSGHDFLMPDRVWLRTDTISGDNGWLEAEPFAETTQNTMSFDAGDIDNDGQPEFFAADMKPFASDAETLAAWQPLMETMHDMDRPDDSQIMENVLLASDGLAPNANIAAASGLSASGWSWSSKFGDLDNDGFLDLYVVNGMAAAEMFGHLPNNELVEENLAFRNQGDGTFVPAKGWGLGSTASGRGMSMADLDGDGDLDIVVNNLRAPTQIFENRLCGGRGVEVDLRWLDSKNTHAIGARLLLHTTTGTYTRDIRSASGYLSGDPSRVHFGVPENAQIERLEVVWPDGQISMVDVLGADVLIEITRCCEVEQVTTAPSTAEAPVVQLRRYVDKYIGFSFDYPMNWYANAQIDSAPDLSRGYFLKITNYDTSRIRKRTHSLADHEVSIQVFTQPYIGEARTEEIEKWLKGRFHPETKFTFVEEMPRKGFDEWSWLIAGGLSSSEMTASIIVKNQRVYLITSNPADGPYKSAQERIIDSFVP